MFEDAVFMLEAPGIPLATRKGTAIPNTPGGLAPAGRVQEFEDTCAAKGLTKRKRACGGYNCFGLVFAHRRTEITEARLIDTILHEDGYHIIEQQYAMPDDVALYRSSDGLPAHVARILRVTHLPQLSIRVVSKWGAHGGETLHPLEELLYASSLDVKSIEIWTDR